MSEQTSTSRSPRFPTLIVALIAGVLVIVALIVLLLRGGVGQPDSLYVPTLLEKAQEYNGKDITVDGAYLGRPGNPATSVLALGVSTLDNGLDAQPLGDLIWLEGFPEENIKDQLHQPGDAIYGFVRINGRFEASGTYGPENKYRYRIQVASVEPIERVQRNEVRIENKAAGEGQVSLFDLTGNPSAYNGQKITTQGYYFWNGPIAVLAEGVSTETDGSSPQPIGKRIWMEGFPPDTSSTLNVGPNNSFVWGKVQVTGQFKSGGGFGKDGAYTEFLQVESATPLEQK